MPLFQVIKLGLFLSLPLAAGCRTWHEAKFNHGYGIVGASTLIVPFSEPRKSLWYCESDDGKIVSESFKAWVREHAEAEFPEGEGVDQVLRLVINWQEKKISSNQWKTLTAGLGAQYVVFGEIKNLALTKPDRIGLLTPSIEASYVVVDVQTEKGTTVYAPPALTVELGRGHETEIPQVDLGDDTGLAKKKLLVRLGAQIAKDLYGYYDE